VDPEAARGQTEIRVRNGLKTLLGERLVEARALLRKYGEFREFNLRLSERLEEILR